MIHYRDTFTGDVILSDEFPITEVAGGYVYEVVPASHDSFIKALRLLETPYAKKDYISAARTYLRSLAAIVSKSSPGRLARFSANTEDWVKEVLAGFDDYRFFAGGSCQSPDQMLIPTKLGEDGVAKFYYFKDGLRPELAVPGVNPWAAYDAATDSTSFPYGDDDLEEG